MPRQIPQVEKELQSVALIFIQKMEQAPGWFLQDNPEMETASSWDFSSFREWCTDQYTQFLLQVLDIIRGKDSDLPLADVNQVLKMVRDHTCAYARQEVSNEERRLLHLAQDIFDTLQDQQVPPTTLTVKKEEDDDEAGAPPAQPAAAAQPGVTAPAPPAGTPAVPPAVAAPSAEDLATSFWTRHGNVSQDVRQQVLQILEHVAKSHQHMTAASEMVSLLIANNETAALGLDCLTLIAERPARPPVRPTVATQAVEPPAPAVDRSRPAQTAPTPAVPATSAVVPTTAPVRPPTTRERPVEVPDAEDRPLDVSIDDPAKFEHLFTSEPMPNWLEVRLKAMLPDPSLQCKRSLETSTLASIAHFLLINVVRTRGRLSKIALAGLFNLDINVIKRALQGGRDHSTGTTLPPQRDPNPPRPREQYIAAAEAQRADPTQPQASTSRAAPATRAPSAQRVAEDRAYAEEARAQQAAAQAGLEQAIAELNKRKAQDTEGSEAKRAKLATVTAAEVHPQPPEDLEMPELPAPADDTPSAPPAVPAADDAPPAQAEEQAEEVIPPAQPAVQAAADSTQPPAAKTPKPRRTFTEVEPLLVVKGKIPVHRQFATRPDIETEGKTSLQLLEEALQISLVRGKCRLCMNNHMNEEDCIPCPGCGSVHAGERCYMPPTRAEPEVQKPAEPRAVKTVHRKPGAAAAKAPSAPPATTATASSGKMTTTPTTRSRHHCPECGNRHPASVPCRPCGMCNRVHHHLVDCEEADDDDETPALRRSRRH